MARPRTPTNILKLRGAGKKNPARMRERENEPKPDGGIGSAPEHLSDAQQQIWDELVDIIPPGVLGNTDRIWLERTSQLLDASRNRPDDWTSSKEKDLIQYLSRLGMSPADRSKVSVPKAPKRSPWEDF